LVFLFAIGNINSCYWYNLVNNTLNTTFQLFKLELLENEILRYVPRK